ncbi:MAG: hypothetical protein ACM3OC_04695 [Deltaproteobacteria bacterium]
MSTLYDALRKAEKTHQVKAGKPQQDIPMIVVIPLCIALVFGIFKFAEFRQAAQKRQKNTASAKASTAGQAAAGAKSSAAKASAAGSSAASVPAPVKKIYVGYELEGVSCNGDFCVAIINGKLLKADETIDTMVVSKIMPGAVELTNPKDNTTRTIQLK